MLPLIHTLLIWLYILLPISSIALSLIRSRRHNVPAARIFRRLLLALSTSLVLGVAACIVYGLGNGGTVPPLQVLLTCYWIAGLLVILKILDFFCDHIARAFFFVGHGAWQASDRQLAAQFLRVLLLFVVGLPYLIIAAVTYRPGMVVPPNPAWQNLGAQPVQFLSTDNIQLSGDWLPAAPPPSRNHSWNWGHQTALLCREPFDSDNSAMVLVTALLKSGYNVMIFDFRAQGQSRGNFITFGPAERRDVLGAVRWMRSQYPEQSHRIIGIGVGTGAAALLSAAADPSRDGQAISAVVSYGSYDRFDSLANSIANRFFFPPLRWIMPRLSLWLLNIQTGEDLRDFSPIDASLAIAPRPILFIHGQRDRAIDFDLGLNLYESASAPKDHLWTEGDTSEALEDPDVAAAAIHFLNTAVPML